MAIDGPRTLMPPVAQEIAPGENPALDFIKQRMRTTALRTRQNLQTGYASPAHAGMMLRDSFLNHFPLPPRAAIAGYWPTQNEIDVRPLLNLLADRDHLLAMPVVINSHQPLRFRSWTPGAQMVPGRFGIPMPPDTLPEVRPTIVLVPLLAFDRRGNRLGRGGGLYDCTLQSLRATGHVTAVGIAFAGQEVSDVPHDIFDQKLDWIVTERTAFAVNTGHAPQMAFCSLL